MTPYRSLRNVPVQITAQHLLHFIIFDRYTKPHSRLEDEDGVRSSISTNIVIKIQLAWTKIEMTPELFRFSC